MYDPITPISENEAYLRVKAQASYYPRFARVFIPKLPFKKLLPGLEVQESYIPPVVHLEDEGLMIGPDAAMLESNLERSLRRSRKAVKDLVFCNNFDHFVTITVARDRQDIDLSKSKIITWVKNEKKRKGKFEYVIVPEFHKDGQSLHFHGLFKGYKGEVKQSFNDKGVPIRQGGRQVYELPSYKSGFTNVKIIDPDERSATKVGFYLQKYITKDMPLLFGKNRYWASSSLKRPVTEDNPEPWYEAIKPTRTYENDYGAILEFDRGTNPLVDMFIEANQK